MATLTLQDQETVLDLTGVTNFTTRIPPGSEKWFHVYAVFSSGRQSESLLKRKHMQTAKQAERDLREFMVQTSPALDCIIDEDTARVVPV